MRPLEAKKLHLPEIDVADYTEENGSNWHIYCNKSDTNTNIDHKPCMIASDSSIMLRKVLENNHAHHDSHSSIGSNHNANNTSSKYTWLGSDRKGPRPVVTQSSFELNTGRLRSMIWIQNPFPFFKL